MYDTTCAASPDLLCLLKVFQGTRKSGQDRVDYILDQPISASVLKFKMIKSNELEKCTRLEVRGCFDSGKIRNSRCT